MRATPPTRLDAVLLVCASLVACQTAPPPPSASSATVPAPSAALVPATSATPPAATAVPPAVAPPANAPSAPAGPAPATVANLQLLEPLICFGNEPFWGVQFKSDGSASCEAMCEGPPGLRVVNVSLSPSGDPRGFDLLDAQGALFLRGVLEKTGKCSDGMSDNLHPYVFTGTGQRGPFEGCCRDKRVTLNAR
jgi:uncharacterized membrane protein